MVMESGETQSAGGISTLFAQPFELVVRCALDFRRALQQADSLWKTVTTARLDAVSTTSAATVDAGDTNDIRNGPTYINLG